MVLFSPLSLVSLALATLSVRAFGITESGDSFILDTSAGLVFTVDSTSGDLTSIIFNDVETQDSSKHSQIASGIGASCTHATGGHDNNYITVTCTASGIIHYYVAKYNDPSIHMATYTSAEPSVGELRYIARLKKSASQTAPLLPTLRVRGTAIEGSDVFLFIDDQVHGVTGSGIGAYMIVPGTGFEGSSGGPFFRELITRAGISRNCIFVSRHTSFYDDLDIEGWYSEAERGRLTGKASGFNTDFSSYIVIGWSNDDAQYWVRTSTDGSYTSPYMKPGTYTMTLYEFELAIGSQSVSVSAGSVGSSNIASTIDASRPRPDVVWQIGDYDGTPRGFLNADMIETVHPSDSRMNDWVSPYTVGDDIYNFPMAIFKDIGAATVSFTLSSSQGGARTLEIATTLAFAGGRPSVTINDWSGDNPAAPDQPDSRGVTRGTWRGNNILYSYAVPDGTLLTDGSTNTLTINVISGSSGDDYLSPNFVVDMVRLY
ncbi:polysaccharide lyase family 4 protein [Schizophyllum amplum]|uniref:rhamnogalacturonan endolyase n=1 Tax=Schizophyllum amplum TaxID=97359 RepID=A0A550C6B3_9AGAR|nr:polysaccharide lyase family 4 protein [Auriculariopsis ampla]